MWTDNNFFLATGGDVTSTSAEGIVLYKTKKKNTQIPINRKLCVTLNTDNRLVSNTSVTNEILLAIKTFPSLITPKLLKSIVLEGFKRSFYPGTFVDKRAYLEKMTKVYETIEKKYHLGGH